MNLAEARKIVLTVEGGGFVHPNDDETLRAINREYMEALRVVAKWEEQHGHDVLPSDGLYRDR